MEAGGLHLRLILAGPDPLPEITRERLESAFGVPVYGLYGVTEMGEPGMAGECPAKDGLHFAEEQFLAEIVHPATGEPAPPGQEGELVVTTLTTEGYPLIRYRTGDIAALHREPCPCGRVSPRVGPLLGRRHQKLKVKGTTLFPSSLQSVLDDTPGVEAYVIVATSEADLSDAVEVRLACAGPVLAELRAAFPGRTKITPRLTVAPRAEIEALQTADGARKRRFFVDRRGPAEGGPQMKTDTRDNSPTR
jgi:phenylacetate-CoA ligase